MISEFFVYDWLTLTSVVLFAFQIAGILSVIHALRRVRTAQATIAWCVGLLAQPVIVVPLYWVFGRSRFFGYRELIRSALSEHRGPARDYREHLQRAVDANKQNLLPLHRIAKVVREPITFGNQLQPLIDGQATFDAILGDIAKAQKYVLAQFFIIEQDEIGRQFADALIERAQAGVEVKLLYDDIGCQWLPANYIERLERAGVKVSSFNMREGFTYRLQVNFRNHRKTVVVDGNVAFTGGLNVGDEYITGGRHFTCWRDTHLRVQGPAVQAIQAVFVVDWYWARREGLGHLEWNPAAAEEPELIDPANPEGQVLVVPTGPADQQQRLTMMICELAAMANERLWISTPYFVPDEAVATALETAVARGVDVRVLIPARPDHMIVFLAGFYYEARLRQGGVGIYRFDHGFMHQKAILLDDSVAAIGTANLDNRSLYLNFELTVLSADLNFVAKVYEMLAHDFERSTATDLGSLGAKPFLFQIMVGAARLFSPVL